LCSIRGPFVTNQILSADHVESETVDFDRQSSGPRLVEAHTVDRRDDVDPVWRRAQLNDGVRSVEILWRQPDAAEPEIDTRCLNTSTAAIRSAGGRDSQNVASSFGACNEDLVTTRAVRPPGRVADVAVASGYLRRADRLRV